MAQDIVDDQRPAGLATVVLPEPRSDLVQVGEPRGLLVAEKVLLIEVGHFGYCVGHLSGSSSPRSWGPRSWLEVGAEKFGPEV